CEIILMHIDDAVLDAEGKIDPYKMDYIARMGGHYYTRVNAESIFDLPQPRDDQHIGVDALPAGVRNSKILTGNNLGQLGALTALPAEDDIKNYLELHKEYISALISSEQKIHQAAQNLLAENKVFEAACILLAHAHLTQ
ncbi:MAG: flavin reductase family protein, partial [Chitinophagales bacterium]